MIKEKSESMNETEKKRVEEDLKEVVSKEQEDIQELVEMMAETSPGLRPAVLTENGVHIN